MALISQSLLALRRDPRLLKVPPYLSFLCIVAGVIWLLLLPLDQYSRHTYISENALLPGQVHTYFSGSEQNIFNAYEHEVRSVEGKPQEEISAKIEEIFRSASLKSARQQYSYEAAGNTYRGENVYAIIRAPRGDGTEAIVLVAAWETKEGKFNLRGVTLALTLARYFKRWSLWSKDIIILITPSSTAGPQAWVDAYHSASSSTNSALPIKSGALQGAIVIENTLDHHFESLHILYDGINGQLPNLDLLNTAVSIASGQMGIGVVLQRMWRHHDSYRERLQTMLRGMAHQGLGAASGAHSSFIPYHVDAITLQAVGSGWQDDMALGRVVESTFRSLNNLLEHFHQSFFFYLLMQANRFVSIGTYLPSAMLMSVSFSIMAIGLWVRSGRGENGGDPVGSTENREQQKEPAMDVVRHGGTAAVVPQRSLAIVERHLFLPITLVASAHLLGGLPLYTFNHTSQQALPSLLHASAITSALLPPLLASLIRLASPSRQHVVLLHCFSLLLLGMFLASLATLNFSLSFLVGLLAAPLSFVGPHHAVPPSRSLGGAGQRLGASRIIITICLGALSPATVIWAGCHYWEVDEGAMLAEAALGWQATGLRTQVVVWCVWWPAWLVGGVVSNLS